VWKNIKKAKERLMHIIEEHGILAETCSLDRSERGRLRNANYKLSKLSREENSKWAHCAQLKHIQGGNNIK
jgi:hypothetical protein